MTRKQRVRFKEAKFVQSTISVTDLRYFTFLEMLGTVYYDLVTNFVKNAPSLAVVKIICKGMSPK